MTKSPAHIAVVLAVAGLCLFGATGAAPLQNNASPGPQLIINTIVKAHYKRLAGSLLMFAEDDTIDLICYNQGYTLHSLSWWEDGMLLPGCFRGKDVFQSYIKVSLTGLSSRDDGRQLTCQADDMELARTVDLTMNGRVSDQPDRTTAQQQTDTTLKEPHTIAPSTDEKHNTNVSKPIIPATTTSLPTAAPATTIVPAITTPTTTPMLTSTTSSTTTMPIPTTSVSPPTTLDMTATIVVVVLVILLTAVVVVLIFRFEYFIRKDDRHSKSNAHNQQPSVSSYPADHKSNNYPPLTPLTPLTPFTPLTPPLTAQIPTDPADEKYYYPELTPEIRAQILKNQYEKLMSSHSSEADHRSSERSTVPLLTDPTDEKYYYPDSLHK